MELLASRTWDTLVVPSLYAVNFTALAVITSFLQRDALQWRQSQGTFEINYS